MEKKRRGRPRKVDQAVNMAEDAKIDFEKDVKEEDKAEWLKRRAKEDREFKKANKKVDEWYVLKGNKLVHKIRKASGGVYAKYICNIKKHPGMLEEVKAKGLLKD